MIKELVFEYAIQNRHGEYYAGTTHPIDSHNWVDNKSSLSRAYTYTEKGAHTKISKFPVYFHGCKVVRPT